MPRVVVVTVSLGTRWEGYSQALLGHAVPEWDRVVVDGRRNWSPTGFLSRVADEDADYILHVDEDCFVEARGGLLQLIDLFEADHGLVAAGVPDGGHFYRAHNPAALNLFFVLFRARSLRKAWGERAQWPQLRFEERFAAEVRRQQPGLDFREARWDEGEPYYPLFWSLLSAGGRFLYLGQSLDRTRWSTHVLSPSGERIAEHLWYLRQWFSPAVMPGHDCPNASRYSRFEADLLARPGIDMRFRVRLAAMQARRLARRAFS
jgi:hypothetical protein